ncbi:uncharacterized protein LOC116951883 isoform X2 [Petromyzon marinus]|uniref:uncharacterized protein LOC116951883 isoform X2 n=1 Tax=Petromyzon marinus TaxID=7757 RepID=UPI003F72B3FC
MPRKLFKCTVELDVQAVTCPGVFLPNKDDIYLSVCMFGQYRKCRCIPAVFPLLVHERLRFQKVFPRATDPADVAQLLEEECVRIELIQLTLPGGESLATHEGDVRCFLFPEPRLTPPAHGSDGQILLNRAHNYPGIAPQLEFSTRTSIVETSRRADGEEDAHWGPCSFCCYGNDADEAAAMTTRRPRGRSPVARTSPKRASAGGAARPAKRRSVSRAAAAVGSRARSTSPRQGYFPGTRSSPSATPNRGQGNWSGKVATVHNVTISYEDGDNDDDDDDDGGDDDDLTVGALAARPLSAPTAMSRRTPLLDGGRRSGRSRKSWRGGVCLRTASLFARATDGQRGDRARSPPPPSAATNIVGRQRWGKFATPHDNTQRPRGSPSAAYYL